VTGAATYGLSRLKQAGVIALALAALWLSLAVTIGLVYAKRNPAVALAGWHSPSAESERAAQQLQQDQHPAALREAETLARRALENDPLNVVAVRTLGLAASLRGRIDAARRWFGVAQWMSRRDLPTQLWLIEDAVGQGRIDQSLRHYDYALNTWRSAEPMLFPILVGASGQVAIDRPLAILLSKRPLWWQRFIDTLISTGNSPVGVSNLVSAVHLDLRKSDEQQLAARAIQRLFQLDAVPQAFALYRQISGNADRGIRNGDFSKANPIPPFDWDLADQADLYASVIAGPDARYPRMLHLIAADGKGGVAAQQLLHLAPGAHSISVLAGGDATDPARRAHLQIACQNSGNAQLVDMLFPTGGPSIKPVSSAFTIPTDDCAFQQIHVVLPGSIDGGTSQAWITGITVRPD